MSILKYKVWNKKEKKYEANNDCIVTQEGKVAFWDESQGWSSDYAHQSDYVIDKIIIETSKGECHEH